MGNDLEKLFDNDWTLPIKVIYGGRRAGVTTLQNEINRLKQKNEKKVAILGKIETKFKAPFDDLSYDIWSMNIHSDTEQIPRVDLWFDIHAKNPNPKADIKREDYPFKDAENLVGGQYFNNSVSYMIAYAILKGYTEIALYGMNFNHDKESRRGEYQNVRELIFFAKGRGINVTAPADKVMLQEYDYYGV